MKTITLLDSKPSVWRASRGGVDKLERIESDRGMLDSHGRMIGGGFGLTVREVVWAVTIGHLDTDTTPQRRIYKTLRAARARYTDGRP
jgi:hypothetical protein